MELSTEGIAIYPRLRMVDIDRIFEGHASSCGIARVSTGITGIDSMLDGGFLCGTMNLVAGHPGTGKSVIAQHFLNAGLQASETCLLLSIRNTPDQVLAQASRLNMDWSEAYADGRLRILHFHPTDLCVDKMLTKLVESIRAACPRRLVFDSIDDLWTAASEEDLVRGNILVLARMFEAAGTTSIMLNEMHQQGTESPGGLDYARLAKIGRASCRERV